MFLWCFTTEQWCWCNSLWTNWRQKKTYLRLYWQWQGVDSSVTETHEVSFMIVRKVGSDQYQFERSTWISAINMNLWGFLHVQAFRPFRAKSKFQKSNKVQSCNNNDTTINEQHHHLDTKQSRHQTMIDTSSMNL